MDNTVLNFSPRLDSARIKNEHGTQQHFILYFISESESESE